MPPKIDLVQPLAGFTDKVYDYSATSKGTGAVLSLTDRAFGDVSSTSGTFVSGSLTASKKYTPAPLNPHSPYAFSGTMPEVVLHRYLDKVLLVAQLALKFVSGPWGQTDGAETHPSYNPWTSPEFLYDESYTHGRLLKMIVDTGAKVVWDAVWMIESAPLYDIEYATETIKLDIAYLHAHDPEIIYCASIGEYFKSRQEFVVTPLPTGPARAELIDMFYTSESRPATADPLYFDCRFMIVDRDRASSKGWDVYSCLDLSKTEARMYYYYLSTKYIDAGCEGIHFGDFFNGCKNDNGNRYLWDLTQKIREYAKKKARRGVVLLDTHALVAVDDKVGIRNFYAWHYYPPKGLRTGSGQDWETQLIFDYISQGFFYEKNSDRPCTDDGRVGDYRKNNILPQKLKKERGMLNHSRAGKHPQGWMCTHSPVLLRFDGGSKIPCDAGCDFTWGAGKEYWDYNYGWDGATAFARQTVREKNLILKYNFYKVKCLDPYCHTSMPARMGIVKRNCGDDGEGAMYNAFTEKEVIKCIWNGAYNGPLDWAPHDFTWENVPNANMPARDSLICVGNDKKFFIGVDGFIHGYVLDNGTYNGGNWLTVSPTYSAKIFHGQNVGGIGGQVAAKSDLVASPDGNTLLYVGVDGYIHGFTIHNMWDYEYFVFMKKEMRWQMILAEGSLIYPTNNRIYYIASYSGDINAKNRVHGFQRSPGSDWQTVSPTYSAASIHGQVLVGQKKASGALAYVEYTPYPRIYYRDILGYLSYYEVRNNTDYVWRDPPVNTMLEAQHLRIVGNLAICKMASKTYIYYVGRHIDSNTYYIHCIVNNGSSWNTVSPTYAAVSASGGIVPASSQFESFFAGNIAVSPDGKWIFYFAGYKVPGSSASPGAWPYVSCFEYIDGISYRYKDLHIQIEESQLWAEAGNSLQFTNNKEIFLISGYSGGKVHRFEFAESYCTNPSIKDYE